MHGDRLRPPEVKSPNLCQQVLAAMDHVGIAEQVHQKVKLPWGSGHGNSKEPDRALANVNLQPSAAEHAVSRARLSAQQSLNSCDELVRQVRPVHAVVSTAPEHVSPCGGVQPSTDDDAKGTTGTLRNGRQMPRYAVDHSRISEQDDGGEPTCTSYSRQFMQGVSREHTRASGREHLLVGSCFR
jgi:hypothetical protein